MKNRNIKIFFILAVMLTAAGCVQEPAEPTAQTETELKIFHAGSLAVPFEEVERQFEALHPNVDVQRETYGSVAAIRQVTDVGKEGDVVASADYSLIPSMMYPDYADWTVRFATNDMVLAYNSEKSKYVDEITQENWYEIIQRDGVTFGFSNPNLDPCGYRAVMVCKLAELSYEEDGLFDELILKNTAITITEDNDRYLIKTPDDLAPNTDKVTIKPKETDLTALVEIGALDYFFIYRSVAVQHNLHFVDLPEEIDLSKVEQADFYKKIQLQTVDEKTKTGKPIVYGITVPKNAPELDSSLKKILKLATGSPYELGLIDALAEPFEAKYNCVVEVTKASTGQGLELGKQGKVDVTLGHAKEALDTYIEEGYGVNRQAVMHNYFVIMGPKDDPAGIRDISDLTEAHRLIANTDSLYLSRGDEGGMHKREKAIWNEIDIDPTIEDWYLVSNDFMMASLRIANERGAYHMADSSTCTVMKDELSSLDAIVVGYPNSYEATIVNPEKYSHVTYGLANKFVEYVISSEGQTIIAEFGKEEFGEPLYYPDAIKETLKLATGSPYELGLIDAIAEPVDLVMVHAPAAEEEFIADGYGLNRTCVMYNDFVIVGPEDDPAGIKGMTNATEAYEKIAESESLFFSRGDNSGTHKKEMSIWETAGITPEGDWYQTTNTFMAETLEIANDEQGHFMTDRSTYITLKDDVTLTVLVEGDPIFVNHYHAIAVNPEKCPNVNYELAADFIEHLSSAEGQTLIAEFGTNEYGEALYYCT
ncbi:tungstate ABC transporter substrate-binding protein WtpA [Methanosarcinales archaeon ex4572_44]|nr:MAG: tungstate ABC transporter substrate-binding protein WtpA [Methanosarcinales archaeon ex4572_44]